MDAERGSRGKTLADSDGRRRRDDAPWRLRLLGMFAAQHNGREVALGIREQRTVALVALHGARPRGYCAGLLWPDATERRAFGSLRAAIWNIQRGAPELIAHDRHRLGLSRDVQVDVDELTRCAGVAIESAGADKPPPTYVARPDMDWLAVLVSGDLLPGWYDEWVLLERGRLQSLRVRALEALAAQFLGRGHTATALSAALAARAIDPLRESAQRAVISVYIAEGNHHAAVREYQRFRARLIVELGVVPSAQLVALVRPLLRAEKHPTQPTLGYALP